jgi:cytochrome b
VPRGGWDLPTRFFHWLLAILVTFSLVTGEIGESWLAWHMKSGYAIIALLVFRLAWGFLGSREARFANFVRSPAAALAYARSIQSGKRDVSPGHSPLAAWSILAMLAAIALQAGTGLFSNDESSHEGPLASKVSDAMVDRMSSIHSWNQYAIFTLVALHLIAIGIYQWRLRMNVVGPMVRGTADVRENVIAAVLLALAAAGTYWLVVVYPR